jgi:FMN phosphatase YigB (HAD superfamily)
LLLGLGHVRRGKDQKRPEYIQAQAMSSKIVLLDVDNVIFTNNKIMNVVQDRIAKYTRKYIQQIRNISMTERESHAFTEFLYRRHGHTLRGMWNYYCPDDCLSVTEFNSQIYDESLLYMLASHLKYNCDMVEQRQDARFFVNRCKDLNIPVGIFSNAPESWCNLILSNYGLDLDPDLLFTSSHTLFHPRRLKPDATLYNSVANSLHNVDEIIFIDDSPVNVKGAAGLCKWSPILYKDPQTLYEVGFELLKENLHKSSKDT